MSGTDAFGCFVRTRLFASSRAGPPTLRAVRLAPCALRLASRRTPCVTPPGHAAIFGIRATDRRSGCRKVARGTRPRLPHGPVAPTARSHSLSRHPWPSRSHGHSGTRTAVSLTRQPSSHGSRCTYRHPRHRSMARMPKSGAAGRSDVANAEKWRKRQSRVCSTAQRHPRPSRTHGHSGTRTAVTLTRQPSSHESRCTSRHPRHRSM